MKVAKYEAFSPTETELFGIAIRASSNKIVYLLSTGYNTGWEGMEEAVTDKLDWTWRDRYVGRRRLKLSKSWA